MTDFSHHQSWNIHVRFGHKCEVDFGLFGHPHRLLQLGLQLVNYFANTGFEG